MFLEARFNQWIILFEWLFQVTQNKSVCKPQLCLSILSSSARHPLTQKGFLQDLLATITPDCAPHFFLNDSFKRLGRINSCAQNFVEAFFQLHPFYLVVRLAGEVCWVTELSDWLFGGEWVMEKRTRSELWLLTLWLCYKFIKVSLSYHRRMFEFPVSVQIQPRPSRRKEISGIFDSKLWWMTVVCPWCGRWYEHTSLFSLSS